MFSKKVIILISGKAGVGKTTLARKIQKELEKKEVYSCIIPFASKVKETARRLGWDGEKDAKGRRLLQDIGKVAREYDPDVWIKKMLNTINTHLVEPDEQVVICDDWRFPNEFSFIDNLGRYYLFTIRVSAPERESLKGTPAYNDESENSLPIQEGFYDYFVDNSGTLDELDMITQNVVQYILDNAPVWA